MKVIPFDPSISSHQNFFINLGSAVCEFDFVWNGRAEAWFVSISTSSGALHSVRLIENTPLCSDGDKLDLGGYFKVIKTNAYGLNQITYDNLGSDWSLVFGSKEEWSIIDGSV